jgi:hypothetical protein
LPLRLSRKFLISLRLFSLMLMTAFRFNFFQTPISGFLGLTIFGLDLLCKVLGEVVRLGCPPVRPVWAPVRPVRAPVRLVRAQLAPMPLFCCPSSVEVLDVAYILLLGDFRSTIWARDGRLVSWPTTSQFGKVLQGIIIPLIGFSIADFWTLEIESTLFFLQFSIMGTR